MAKPLLCRLGFHQPYSDSAFYNSVARCNRCDWVDDAEDAKRLDRERQLWSEGPEGETFSGGIARVGLAMFEQRGREGS